MESHLGWASQDPGLRESPERLGLCPAADAKAHDPKEAVEWASRKVGKARPSSIDGNLVMRIRQSSFSDRSFVRFKPILLERFPKRKSTPDVPASRMQLDQPQPSKRSANT